MEINNPFPPPSIKEEVVTVSTAKILGGLAMFVIVAGLYAVILNGLLFIVERGGVIDWDFSLFDIFLGVLFVQFIRVLDAVWRRRLQ
jgi:hypothetical protein